jgi:hypothetical protein
MKFTMEAEASLLAWPCAPAGVAVLLYGHATGTFPEHIAGLLDPAVLAVGLFAGRGLTGSGPRV